MIPRTVADWIGKNLAWMIGGIAMGYAGYTSGLTRIASLEQHDRDQEAREVARRALLGCMVRHFDRLEAGATNPPGCELEAPE